MQRGPHSTEEGLFSRFDLRRIAYVGTVLLLGLGLLFAQEQKEQKVGPLRSIGPTFKSVILELGLLESQITLSEKQRRL